MRVTTKMRKRDENALNLVKQVSKILANFGGESTS
jgi:hypothetical protein